MVTPTPATDGCSMGKCIGAAVPVWRAGIRLDGGSDTGRHSGPIGAVMVRKKVTAAACGAALKHFTAATTHLLLHSQH